MQHLSIAVSPPVFHIFSRFLGGAESPNVELSRYVIFIFLTVLVGQRFLLYHENSCRGRRRGCATDFFWSAGFLFPNQSSCPISGRSVQPLWSAQKAVRLWGSITDLIIIGLPMNRARETTRGGGAPASSPEQNAHSSHPGRREHVTGTPSRYALGMIRRHWSTV